MKHVCGCVTTKDKKGIIHIVPCEQHQYSGYVWIVLQHKEPKIPSISRKQMRLLRKKVKESKEEYERSRK